MKTPVSVITRKGQVTIPIEIRRALALEEGDKITFEMDGTHVRLARSEGVVTRTAGALRSKAPRFTPEQEREAAEQAIAEDVVHRMGA